MRNPFDQFAKQMLHAALAGRGSVETEVEVTAEIRTIDGWFTPVPSGARIPDELGLLGWITIHPSTLEFRHSTPNGDELCAYVIKHGDFHRSLARRAELQPFPNLWVISPGRPDEGIEGLAFQPLPGAVSGIYQAPKLLWTYLVVVRELPVTRYTLLVRLLGGRALMQRAIAELRALPLEAPERQLALPILVELRLAVPDDPAEQARDDQEFLVNTHEVYELWRQQTIEEGREQGLEQGLRQGERALLLRQLRRRFGSQVDGEIERRVEAASPEQVEIWADRVLSAATLAALLTD
jgi:Domain of unknown function (DUF4351)